MRVKLVLVKLVLLMDYCMLKCSLFGVVGFGNVYFIIGFRVVLFRDSFFLVMMVGVRVIVGGFVVIEEKGLI